MTSIQFDERLSARALNVGVAILPVVRAQLEVYFRLLTRWNERINLTALPLSPPTDETFDRLLIEPVVAARFMAESPRAWFDLGSGGGSPAIPLKIAHPSAGLTMIESTAKKAAFLREAIRVLGLTDAVVLNERFDAVSRDRVNGCLDLVTVRAIKCDATLFGAIHRLLGSSGRLFLFHSSRAEPEAQDDRFLTVEVVRLGTAQDARLSILSPLLFHVEQSR